MTARKTDHAVEPGGVLSVGVRNRVCTVYMYVWGSISLSQQICRGGEYIFPFAVSHISSPALLLCSLA